jgi:hypothetical protein
MRCVPTTSQAPTPRAGGWWARRNALALGLAV